MSKANKYTHFLQEFGTIYNAKDYPGEKDCFNAIFIEDKAFQHLRNFISENIDPDIEVGHAFSIHRKKAKDFIRVKNYVGVIETLDHTHIEILPKIFLQSEKDMIVETRKIFLRMLRHLKDSPFKSIDNAMLKTTKFPILEIFIKTFLDELDLLIQRGLQSQYVKIEENVKFLKGSLKFSEHLKLNLLHKERFFVSFDEFCIDIPHNRLIKSTLEFLKSKSRSSKNKTRIHNLLHFFEEVKESPNIEKDLSQITQLNRMFSNYSKVLQWARIFLLDQSFTNFKGNNINKAILFPMERIFEDYIGAGFKKYTDFDVALQDKKVALVDEHNGSNKFKLKPDIYIDGDKPFILDTKWKLIDQNKPRKNYLISQGDMYQLFAYGKKYSYYSESKSRLALLYPKHENFIETLADFNYDDATRLTAIPVNLDCSLSATIGEILEKLSDNLG
jgi:5-methylcytosine-specific restriction enzyme subunit McrC